MTRQSIRLNVKTVFWNGNEKRFRALWRLLGMASLTGIILLTLLMLMGILFSVSNSTLELEPFDLNQIPFNIQFIATFISAGSVLVGILLSCKIIDHRRFADLGFHLNQNWWIDFGFGLLLGAVLMAAIFLVELTAGWITINGIFVTNTETSFLFSLLQNLILFLFVGVYEETITRGYLLLNLAEGLHLPHLSAKQTILLAWFFSSLVFGSLHAGNPHASIISTLNLVLAGLFLGLGYVLTGELAISIGLHITWNFFQGNVFGFPVSGTTPAATVVAVQQGGQEFLTGGRFGPEAGLIGIAAILLGSLLIYIWVRRKTGKASLQERLTIYPKVASS